MTSTLWQNKLVVEYFSQPLSFMLFASLRLCEPNFAQRRRDAKCIFNILDSWYELRTVILLILISGAKLNAFIALTIAAFFVGILKAMPFTDLINSIQQGIGSTLGSLIFIIAFGVILGNLLSDSGAAQRISSVMIRSFGIKHIKWVMVITGFSVGISMFYNAGFIILIPMVFAVAKSTKQPIIYLGIAMASALSITHGFLPPHPGPTAIAVIFKAAIGKTLLYGLIVAIPALVAAGIIFPEFIKKINAFPPKGLFESKTFTEAEMPSFQISIITALVPVFLMAAATFSELLLSQESSLRSILIFMTVRNSYQESNILKMHFASLREIGLAKAQRR